MKAPMIRTIDFRAQIVNAKDQEIGLWLKDRFFLGTPSRITLRVRLSHTVTHAFSRCVSKGRYDKNEKIFVSKPSVTCDWL